MHAKHPIWRKETTYPETCLLGVMHQNAKKKDMERTLYVKTKHYQKKNCLLSVFEIRTKNDKTHAKHSLWMNNNITTNVYFQCL